VCAVGDDACGWAGWIVDEVCAGVPHEDASMSGCELLPADYREKCPQCGKQLFRTAFERSWRRHVIRPRCFGRGSILLARVELSIIRRDALRRPVGAWQHAPNGHGRPRGPYAGSPLESIGFRARHSKSRAARRCAGAASSEAPHRRSPAPARGPSRVPPERTAHRPGRLDVEPSRPSRGRADLRLVRSSVLRFRPRPLSAQWKNRASLARYGA
jgi:hypothetical protein